MNHIVFIAMGSNLGNRSRALLDAVEHMAPEIKLVSFSKIYETPPWGYEDQPLFLNQVFIGQTNLSPDHLLVKLKDIEQGIGRQPNFRYGPRHIDLDILFYDNLHIVTDDLTIPHPEIEKRAFVLVPLLEIAPEFVHPVSKKTIAALAAEIETDTIKEYQVNKKRI